MSVTSFESAARLAASLGCAIGQVLRTAKRLKIEITFINGTATFDADGAEKIANELRQQKGQTS